MGLAYCVEKSLQLIYFTVVTVMSKISNCGCSLNKTHNSTKQQGYHNQVNIQLTIAKKTSNEVYNCVYKTNN